MLPKLLALLSGAGGLIEELRGLRLDLRENTTANRENTAALRDGHTKAVVALTEELRRARIGH